MDGHYGYLQEEKEEVRQKRTEELAGRLIEMCIRDRDYPVMHTPENPQKYLRRSFYGEYSVSGVPFLDVYKRQIFRCSMASTSRW